MSFAGVLIGFVLGLAFAALTSFVLWTNGYQFTPKSIRLPWLEADLTNFNGLSPVKMFIALSRRLIPSSTDARAWLDQQVHPTTPFLQVHIGWRAVSDAYIKRYGTYPAEDDVRTRVADLGGQNVEFVLLYEKVYSAAVRNEHAIPKDFAREYFLRSPSMAERIMEDGSFEPDWLFRYAAQLSESLPENSQDQFGADI